MGGCFTIDSDKFNYNDNEEDEDKGGWGGEDNSGGGGIGRAIMMTTMMTDEVNVNFGSNGGGLSPGVGKPGTTLPLPPLDVASMMAQASWRATMAMMMRYMRQRGKGATTDHIIKY